MNDTGTDKLNAPASFAGLGIAPKIMEILDRMEIKTPTPIQHQAIPVAIQGQDLIGIAQTGTGKTLAFGVPMTQRLLSIKGNALVVLPTRELAVQVNDALLKLTRGTDLKSAVLIGGENMNKQRSQLRARPRIIIGTPGRIIDHMEQKNLDLAVTSILVLDEADRMFDMGFAPQIKKILDKVSKDRQTMLFSATMPPEIVKIATGYMKIPSRIEVAPAGTTSQNITQEVFFVQKADKMRILSTILSEYKGSVLLFSRTKFGAKRIASAIRDMGHTASEIHSNRTLPQRLEALRGFKVGKYRVLVATDIAARGIDVKGIELVVNFDLPENPEDYVHRIGRTGRADHEGRAISLATPDQKRDVTQIEKLIQKTLPLSKLPGHESEEVKDAPEGRKFSTRRGSGGGGSFRSRSFGGRRGFRK
jgi:ATP-dependent RNA helicase RhlE